MEMHRKKVVVKEKACSHEKGKEGQRSLSQREKRLPILDKRCEK